MCPVSVFRLWMLTELEWMRSGRESGRLRVESGHDLTIRVTER
jgi:hypothetical protein